MKHLQRRQAPAHLRKSAHAAKLTSRSKPAHAAKPLSRTKSSHASMRRLRTKPSHATVSVSRTKQTSRPKPAHTARPTSRPMPAQRVHQRPHRRKGERFANLRSLVRSPLFAYGAAAVVIAAVLFALTIPTERWTYIEPAVEDTPEPVAKPYPQNEEPVEPRAIAHPLEGTSAEAVSTTNAYGVLTQAIGEFEDTGDMVSFAMVDLATGNTLAYDSRRVQYPASSIKAPYTCAVYEQLLETGQANFDEVRPLAEETILESNDDTYRELHDRYGMEVFSAWLQDAGVGPGEYASYGEMLVWNYPHLCCDQLLGMWLHIYDYVQRDTPYAQHLGSLLEQRGVSAMRAALGPDVRTQSKMGWFDYVGDYFSEPATVEGGVVYASEGTYVVAVMSTAPAQIYELEPIFTALARAHFDMI